MSNYPEKAAGGAYEPPQGFDEVSRRLARERRGQRLPPRTPAERDYYAHLAKSTAFPADPGETGEPS